jgi:peptidoglycan/xylan/chitin deacetylase (PgdA/CDA1 family)
MSRRMMLVGSGGLMLAVATAAGCSAGGLAGAPRGETSPAAGGQAVARISPQARETAWPARPGAPRRPGGRARAAAPHDRATRRAAPAEPVYYVHDGPKGIALTIDDGPSPVYTPQILRILERYRVTASFSMIGQNVTYYPGVARDVADAGHAVVNHTWDHANLAVMSSSAMRAEISRATEAIHAAAGERPKMFRAPYGAWSHAMLEYCASEHLMPLDWSVDPRDWARPGAGAIIANIMRNTRAGSIILEHDGGGDRSQTVAALEAVIPRLLDEGYRFQVPWPSPAA